MKKTGNWQPIPVSVAKRISDDYGYDQVVIVARSVGDNGEEWVTTYGKTKEHCDVAAKMAPILQALNNGKAKVMWLQPEENRV